MEEAVFLLQDSSVMGRVKELLALVYTGQTTVETSEDLEGLDAQPRALQVVGVERR